MDPTQQTAAEYYKHHRKSSLFSRITILSSMAILVLVLAINILVLYSQDAGSIKSNASTPQNVENLLPSLPAGCQYQHVGDNVKVYCQKAAPGANVNSAAPTSAVSIPLNVALPQLPSGCSILTSANGSSVQCTGAQVPIPTAPVNLPATCTVANEPNTVTCTYGNNQTATIPLPKLPDGCSYFLGAGKYYVVCEVK